MANETLTTEYTEKKECTEFWLVSVSHARSPPADDENESPLHVSSPSLTLRGGVGQGWGVAGDSASRANLANETLTTEYTEKKERTEFW